MSAAEKPADGRISCATSAHAEAALRRLAQHYGVSPRAILERLIGDAESAVVDNFSVEDQRRYYRSR